MFSNIFHLLQVKKKKNSQYSYESFQQITHVNIQSANHVAQTQGV